MTQMSGEFAEANLAAQSPSTFGRGLVFVRQDEAIARMVHP